MKILEKIENTNGKIKIYCCGMRIFSYIKQKNNTCPFSTLSDNTPAEVEHCENFSFYSSQENSSQYIKAMQNVTARENDLQNITHNNATIIPYKVHENLPYYYGGVLDENGNFCKNSFVARNLDGQGISNVDTVKVHTSYPNYIERDETVVFLGVFFMHWGHFLIESLARSHFFLNPEHKHYKAVYVKDGKLGNNIQEIIKLFGFHDIECIEKPTKFKTIISPEPAFRISKYIHPKYLEIMNRISSQVKPDKHEKIYLTRRECQSDWIVFGEKFIEAIFKANGYKIIAPETYSAKKQIALMKGAKVIAGTVGTALHNILFCHPKQDVTCIWLNRQTRIETTQLIICKHTNIKTIYVNTHLPITSEFDLVHVSLIGPTKYFHKFCADNQITVSLKQLKNFSKILNNFCLYYLKNYCQFITKPSIKKQTTFDFSNIPLEILHFFGNQKRQTLFEKITRKKISTRIRIIKNQILHFFSKFIKEK